MKYGLLILAALLAGCRSKPEEPTSKNEQSQPADVAAIRGSGANVSAPAPYSNGFAASIDGQISALNKAKATAADANAKIKREDQQNSTAGQ